MQMRPPSLTLPRMGGGDALQSPSPLRGEGWGGGDRKRTLSGDA
jgi:hypothetical protein